MNEQEDHGDRPARPEMVTLINFDTFGQDPSQWHWVRRYKRKVWWKALIFTLTLLRLEGEKTPTPFQKWLVLSVANFFLALPVMLLVITALWPGALLLLKDAMIGCATDAWQLAVVFVVFCAGGCVAYVLREVFRTPFGIAEILFAMFCIWFGLSEGAKQQPDSFKMFAGTVGGIYVMVRGWDNVVKGWGETKTFFAELMRRPHEKTVPWPAVELPEDTHH